MKTSALRTLAAVLIAAAAATLTSCSTDADVVNKNISQDADNFKVLRRVTFINGITDKYILTIEGYCSIDTANPADLTVTCKVGDGDDYKRTYLGRSDNVTWIVEQLTAQNVSPHFYQVTFKPETVVPDVTVR